MNKYTRSFIRFLPNPETQEFINIGVIVIDSTSGYCAFRRAKCKERILGLSSYKELNDVDIFFEWLERIVSRTNLSHVRDARRGVLFLAKFYSQNLDQYIQVSEPEVIEGNSPESYIDSIMGTVILEDPETPEILDDTPHHPGLYKASEIGRSFDNCLSHARWNKKNKLQKALGYSWKAIDTLIDILETFFKKVGDHYIHKLYAKNEIRRMKSPIYREIEGRRSPEGHPRSSIIYLSAEHNLGLEEINIQDKIREWVDLNPWWLWFAYRLSDSPITNSANLIKYYYQKITRGWTDPDVWGLSTSFCASLGERLLTLSHTGHGYPGIGNYTDPDRWMEDLHKYGYALFIYGNFDAGNEVEESYFEGLDSKIRKDPKNIGNPAYWEQHFDREEYTFQKAQEALRWVATYLQHLGD